jgi:hypothetical protein
MRDKALIKFLTDKLGVGPLAQALGLDNHQTINNWRERGIAAPHRYPIWKLANEHGAALPVSWPITSAPPEQRPVVWAHANLLGANLPPTMVKWARKRLNHRKGVTSNGRARKTKSKATAGRSRRAKVTKKQQRRRSPVKAKRRAARPQQRRGAGRGDPAMAAQD